MTLADLLEVLDLERVDDHIFVGRSHATPWGRVFGGQVLAQSLVASALTVPDEREVHSMHGYFILGGDPDRSIVYSVEALRDGRSFTTRRCTALQHGRPIFNSAASFHKHEEGVAHQAEMPEVPGPESLPTLAELAERYRGKAEGLRQSLQRPLPIERRPVEDYNPLQPAEYPPHYRMWIKAQGTLSDDMALHRAVLAYASDYHLLTTALVPHLREVGFHQMMLTSLDHAMWFHAPRFRADEWMLFDIDTPWAGGARGFTRARVFSQSGELLCSVTQEGLLRKIR